MAERAGFEPAVHLTAHTRFPSVLLKPLGHLSVPLISEFPGEANLTKKASFGQRAPGLERRTIDVDDVLEEGGGGSAGIGAAAGHGHRAHGIREEGDALHGAVDVDERM